MPLKEIKASQNISQNIIFLGHSHQTIIPNKK